jgi:hypothetical protein
MKHSDHGISVQGSNRESQMTHCLEVCFTQRVNQSMPSWEAVRGVRG